MNKEEAIEYVNQKLNIDLNKKDTVFANVGKHKENWWLEPAISKLKSGFYFILNDPDRNRLLLFKVPKDAVDKSAFRLREDKGVCQMIIPISNKEFIDKNGYSFNQFFVTEVEYRIDE